MARYRIEDSVVNTEKATAEYSLEWPRVGYGRDRRSLCRTRKGRWYLVHDFDWSEDGCSLDYAEWVSPEEAVRLLLAETNMSEDDIATVHTDLAEAISNVAE